MIAVIIQARMGSKRLPGKVLKTLGIENILNILVKRLKKSQIVEKIIISTTNKKEDDKIIEFCNANKIKTFRGSEKDLIDRFIKTAEYYNLSTIVRITGDCPLVDPFLIDKAIKIFFSEGLDYFSNTCPPKLSHYPDGSDIEIFEIGTLKEINRLKLKPKYREHLTNFYWKEKKYKTFLLKDIDNFSNIKYSVDTLEDFERLEKLYRFYKNKIYDVTTLEIINFLENLNETKI
tara:strand:- start:2130 stop:2828 length:699 start_codon:yes stop_codon:yes gene_type:complete